MDGSFVGLSHVRNGNGSRRSCQSKRRTKSGEQNGNLPEPDFHEIQDVDTAADEEDFHDKVVEGDPCGE